MSAKTPSDGSRIELSVAAASVAHGDLIAVWDVSLELRTGSVTALVGRNGAGKTTLLAGISGLLPLRGGSVTMFGKDITRLPAWQRVASGMSLVQEGKRVFRDLSVRDNLILGMRAPRAVRRNEVERSLADLYDRFPVLGDKRDQLAASLSGGQQQILAIATAVACRPRILLVDEPSSGLAPVFVDTVFKILAELRDEGLAILLVEQLVDEVLDGLAEDVIVLDGGKVTLRGRASELSADDIAQGIYAAAGPAAAPANPVTGE